MRGVKKLENMQFCHKTFQEFFGALWLASNYEKEKSKLYQCVKTISNVLDYSILIQFMCGLCPEAGAEFWRYVAVEVIEKDEEIMNYRNGTIDPIFNTQARSIQELILKAVREACDCSDQQSKQVYYYIPDVLDQYISDEDFLSLLCDMMQNNTDYMKSLSSCWSSMSSPQRDSICRSVSCATRLQLLYLKIDFSSMSSPQWDSICRSVSCATNLQTLLLYCYSRSCSTKRSSDPVLDLQNHNRLKRLKLEDLSINSLLLPGQEELPLWKLSLSNLVLSHESLVQVCGSLSSSCSGLKELHLTSLSCSDQSGSCLPALDLQKHHGLQMLVLDKLPISSLLLPGQEESALEDLKLENLVLSHDSLVQVCRSLPSLSGLNWMYLTNLSCSDQSGKCLPVLDLRKLQRLQKVKLSELSVNGLLPDTRIHLPPYSIITSYGLIEVTMSAHSWRRFIEGLAQSSSAETVSVRQKSCNIDSGTRYFISSSPQFIVEKNDDHEAVFEIKSVIDSDITLPNP